MRIWKSYFKKKVTAAVIVAAIAVGLLGTKTAVYAATAATDSVMIRNDASTDAGIIGSLNEGDEVEILDVIQSGDGYLWYYIELDNGNTGYVRSDLINASDEELADFDVEEEEPEDEPEEVPEEKPAAQPEPEKKKEKEKEEPAPSSGEEISADQSAVESVQTSQEGYDASRDPNANFSVRFETDADGSGSWYVYNEDNGSRVRLSDMQSQENAAATSRGSGIWKTLAIIFGILAIAFAAFSLFLIRSIRGARPMRERRRAVEAAAEEDEEEEGDDEAFFFEDDDDADEEDDTEDEDDEDDEDEDVTEEDDQEESESAEEEKPGSQSADATITKEITEPSEITEIPAEEIEAAIAAETALIEKEAEKAGDALTKGDEPEATAGPEPENEQVSEEVFEDASVTASFDETAEAFEKDGFAGEEEDEEYEEEDYEDEDDSEEDAGEEPDEDYEEEDYDDEDSYEESDEEDFDDDEFYDDDDEGGTRRRARSSRGSVRNKGGLLGFFKKVFGSDSSEDDEDDFDDFDEEPVRREFDEFKDYPEDIDLLPKEHLSDLGYDEDEESPDDDGDEDYSGRGRLTMQRVMKNVRNDDRDAAFDDGGDMDDLSDSLFDDDDDMEYSFISNTRRK